MKIKFEYDENGKFWHGFMIWKTQSWFDCGLFAIDYNKYEKLYRLYVWKFIVQVTL